MPFDLQDLIAGTKPWIQSAMVAIDGVLTGRGCRCYVKTIYAGYFYSDELVAAAYPRADLIEVALALPEDTPGPRFIDATHLTWRTMPIAFVLKGEADLAEALEHAESAADRVATGLHDVNRPADFFMGRHERGASPPGTGLRQKPRG